MEECLMTFTSTYITKLAGAFFARTKVLLAIAGILLLSLLIACAPPEDDDDGGGSVDTYTVGGTVAGHTGDVSLTLTYGEETETLKIETGTDKFTFAAKLVANQSFVLEVTGSPDGQFCRSSILEGTIVDSDITNIVVTCSDSGLDYTVSGTVSGLASGETITLTLMHEGVTSETKEVEGADDGSEKIFIFIGTSIASGETFTLTTTSPSGKTCTVDPAGQQTIENDNVDDVAVTCVAIPTYSVSGSVTGTTDTSQITVTLLHGDPPVANLTDAVTLDVTPNTDGTFSFDVPVNKYYLLSAVSANANEMCSPISTAFLGPLIDNQSNFNISCSIATANTYAISGTVSGLMNGEAIALSLRPTVGNGENNIITADADATTADNFTFGTKLANGETYTVTVLASPASKSCTVDDAGTQTMGNADVTDIAVTCVAAAYSISGTVSGATDSTDIFVVLTLYDDNAGAGAIGQTIKGNADGTFSFAGIAENKFYILQASSAQMGETCTGAPSTPTLVTANVTDARITCATSTGPSIRVTLESLAYETSLTTVNVFIGDNAIPATTGTATKVIRGIDADVVILSDVDGNSFDGYNYDIPIDAGKYYAVTATTTSGTETCAATLNGSGGPINANVIVIISCQ